MIFLETFMDMKSACVALYALPHVVDVYVLFSNESCLGEITDAFAARVKGVGVNCGCPSSIVAAQIAALTSLRVRFPHLSFFYKPSRDQPAMTPLRLRKIARALRLEGVRYCCGSTPEDVSM